MNAIAKGMVGVLVLLGACFSIQGLAEAEPAPAAKTVLLSSLDLTKISMTGLPGAPLKRALNISGRSYNDGIWMCAHGYLYVQLDAHGTRFSAQVGMDATAKIYGVDEKKAAAVCYVLGDGRELWKSPVMRPGDPAVPVSVDVSGVRTLVLIALPMDRNYPANIVAWAEAQVETDGYAPQTVLPEREAAEVLTPTAPAKPRINAPRIYGARPGNLFLFLLPVSGERPIEYAASGLPEGLALDAATGMITGVAKQAGTYRVEVTAKNLHGQDTNMLRLVIGDTIALTPSMGFNDWYSYGLSVDEKAILSAAHAMVDSGMSQYGYSYVNIDDAWMVRGGQGYSVLADDSLYADPKAFKEALKSYKLAPGESEPGHGAPRDEQGRINANPSFPNMKAMTDTIHSLGLKAGIYSSPGPITCAGYVGSFKYEDQDAQRFAEWGFDFLKYDWCYYGWRWAPALPTLDQMQEPFIRINEALRKQPRDIVLNLCQYGMGNVWEWGKTVGGHCWRTANDLGAVFNGNSYYSNIVSIALSESGLEQWAGPGHWNDPDYLLLGKTFNVSPNEAYSYMSFWSLLASPLIYSGRMDQLDPFTLNVLCNSEVIEVNQDPLGQQARVVVRDGFRCVLLKDMEDGSKAVGLFNIGEYETKIAADWKTLGLSAPMKVRDLWRQKDLGVCKDSVEVSVPRHGVVMMRLSAANPGAEITGVCCGGSAPAK